jgi:hypothetical protein
MSFTLSRGYTIPSDLAGVSASTAEYLENYLQNKSQERIPYSAFRHIKQFFEASLYGTQINQQKEPENSPIPRAEGTTKFAIIYGLLNRINPELIDKEFKGIERIAISSIEDIKKILSEEIDSIPQENLKNLYKLLVELMREGLEEMESMHNLGLDREQCIQWRLQSRFNHNP